MILSFGFCILIWVLSVPLIDKYTISFLNRNTEDSNRSTGDVIIEYCFTELIPTLHKGFLSINKPKGVD